MNTLDFVELSCGEWPRGPVSLGPHTCLEHLWGPDGCPGVGVGSRPGRRGPKP